MRQSRSLMCYKIGVVVVLVLIVVIIIAFKIQGSENEAIEGLTEKPVHADESLALHSLPKENVATESLNTKSSPIDSFYEKKVSKKTETIESTPTLSKNVLALVNDGKVTLELFNQQFESLPSQIKEYFKDDKVGFLEELIVRQLLLREAIRKNVQEQAEYKAAVERNPGQKEQIMINVLLNNIVADISISEQELKDFFNQYKDQFPNKDYESIKEQIRPMASEEKQRTVVEEYINKLKSNAKIVRNKEWIKEQEMLATDNPLTKALKLGKPVVADFGRGTCIPCKMMQPILEQLQKDYEGRASILILDVGEYASLARKYGIQLIPTQIFFDPNGKEAYRHQGFMPEEDIVAQLKKLGVE